MPKMAIGIFILEATRTQIRENDGLIFYSQYIRETDFNFHFKVLSNKSEDI